MIISKQDTGKLINVIKNNINYKGFLINITDKENQQEITLKLLDNGYNIGLTIDKDTKIEILEEKKDLGKKQSINVKQNDSLFPVSFVSTGGTIGTHVDYKTGGVNMSRTPEEIISVVPELLDIINIKKILPVAMKGSEDLSYKDWQNISKAVYEQLIDPEIKAVIISHGTDTLTWTGTVLSFMIENINKPVVLVGAQKSPDRASFDGAMNLICAAHFVKEQIPGVYVVMHGSMSDDFCNVIRATKCRKMHSSRRDSFRAINDSPIARAYQNGKTEYLKDKNQLLIKPKTEPKLFIDFSNSVSIVKAYPNSDPKILEWYIKEGYKGIIIEGTGLGHCPTGLGGDDKSFDKTKNWLPYIKQATENGVIVIITTQCIYGRVNGAVYANLRYIQEAGGCYLDSHDMLPEVAYLKLCVSLSRFKTKEEIINYMKKNVSGEISKKETPENFECDF